MQLATELLSAIGEVVTVDREELIDSVTAVSGSGPAYVFYMTECLAAAAEKIGLPPALAMQLARATVAGSGELMRVTGTEAATLRQNVTSPKGTTHAALQVLMADDGLEPLFEKAVKARQPTAPGNWQARCRKLSFDDFMRRLISASAPSSAVEPFPEARKPAFKLRIDFGGRDRHEKIIGPSHEILHAGNPDRPSGGRRGQFSAAPDRPLHVGSLDPGFPDHEGDVVLVAVERPVPNGGRMY